MRPKNHLAIHLQDCISIGVFVCVRSTSQESLPLSVCSPPFTENDECSTSVGTWKYTLLFLRFFFTRAVVAAAENKKIIHKTISGVVRAQGSGCLRLGIETRNTTKSILNDRQKKNISDDKWWRNSFVTFLRWLCCAVAASPIASTVFHFFLNWIFRLT